MMTRLAWVGLVLALTVIESAPAAATSHCFCKVFKSDCGACNTRCVARDLGAIAEFGTFELHKDTLCREACNRKLAAETDVGLCTALAQTLRVPMPWGGPLHTCWHVGTDRDTTGAARAVSCASAPPALPPPGAPYWRMTFADEFKGKPANATPAEAQCYDRAPTCFAIYRGGPEVCPAATHPGLRHLNKCTWSILTRNNWMMADSQVNAFDPREVTVEPGTDDGVLILSAHGVRPDGAYYPLPTPRVVGGKLVSPAPYVSKQDPAYDCVWVPDPWTGKAYRDRCPIISGAVVSQNLSAGGGPAGFQQKYGKFEIRAKLSYGPGSFPAQWLLPQSGSWPGAGELDIIEAYTAGDYVNMGVIGGLCMPGGSPDLDPNACDARGGQRWTVSQGQKNVQPLSGAPFWAGYHVFGMEWTPQSVRYLVDGAVRAEFKHLDLLKASRQTGTRPWLDKLAFWNNAQWKTKLPFFVPDRDFYLLLNQSIMKDDSKKPPNPQAFVPQKHMIDYVRAYQRCQTAQDFCPQGGAFDVASNACTGARPYLSPCRR